MCSNLRRINKNELHIRNSSPARSPDFYAISKNRPLPEDASRLDESVGIQDTEISSLTDAIVPKCNHQRNDRDHYSKTEAKGLEIGGHQHLISKTLSRDSFIQHKSMSHDLKMNGYEQLINQAQIEQSSPLLQWNNTAFLPTATRFNQSGNYSYPYQLALNREILENSETAIVDPSANQARIEAIEDEIFLRRQLNILYSKQFC